MIATLALVLLHHRNALLPVAGFQVWEEDVVIQKSTKGYHPILRFSCWQIQRYNLSITYMMNTPDLIQQGMYAVQSGKYGFHAIMANELENADIAHIEQSMDAPDAQELGKAYARSMNDFQGDYNDTTKILTISYPVKGSWRTFSLHSLTEGDDVREVAVSQESRGMIGLWHGVDTHPEKLDARTRYKIGDLDGLKRFAREAGESEGSLLSVMDLRADGTFRDGPETGTWHRNGNVLTLVTDHKIEYTISNDGKLLSGGKPAFARD